MIEEDADLVAEVDRQVEVLEIPEALMNTMKGKGTIDRMIEEIKVIETKIDR